MVRESTLDRNNLKGISDVLVLSRNLDTYETEMAEFIVTHKQLAGKLYVSCCLVLGMYVYPVF